MLLSRNSPTNTNIKSCNGSLLSFLDVGNRDVEAGSGPFSVEEEARKFYRFRFHIGYLT